MKSFQIKSQAPEFVCSLATQKINIWALLWPSVPSPYSPASLKKAFLLNVHQRWLTDTTENIHKLCFTITENLNLATNYWFPGESFNDIWVLCELFFIYIFKNKVKIDILLEIEENFLDQRIFIKQSHHWYQILCHSIPIQKVSPQVSGQFSVPFP